MTVPPLTHHAIMRLASPLSMRGLKIDMTRSNRNDRYIEFQAQSSFLPQIRCIHSLTVGTENRHRLSRVLIHSGGLIATLEATATNLDTLIEAFEKIPHERQMLIQNEQLIAYSYALRSLRNSNTDDKTLQMQLACCHLAGLEIRVDTSTGGAMPADVRIIVSGKSTTNLPDSLASGEDHPLSHRAARHSNTTMNSSSATIVQPPAVTATTTVTRIPEDFLAVLGAQWRPLRFQGDHWKGVLRTLGSEPTRTSHAERFVKQAVEHLSQCLCTSPTNYHERLQAERWRVYVRRLKPLMLFVSILAMMPLSWLLVSRGGMALHPLALGLTPLLMVGVVVMTAREIPVMEIPAKPVPLPEHYWASVTDDA